MDSIVFICIYYYYNYVCIKININNTNHYDYVSRNPDLLLSITLIIILHK